MTATSVSTPDIRDRSVPARLIGARRAIADRALPWGTVFVVALLVGVPVGFMAIASFRGPGTVLPLTPEATWTTGNYAEVIDGRLLSTLGDTALFVGGSLLIALGVGLPLAWLLNRTDIPAARTLTLCLIAPLLLAPIANAQAWSTLISPDTGLLNELLRLVVPGESGPIDTQKPSGLIFAQGMTYVPLVALFLGPSLANIDAPLEEASRLSGASPVTTFRRVTLRLMLPAVLSVGLLLSVLLIGQFELPLVFGLGTDTLRPVGIVVFRLLNPPASVPAYGEIAAYSVFVTAIGYVLMLSYGRLTARSDRFATVTGKGHHVVRLPLGRWRWPAFVAVVGLLTTTVGLRIFVLAWQSIVPFRGDISWSTFQEHASLDGFRRVLSDAAFWESTRTTAVVAAVSSVVTTGVGLAMAWTVARSAARRAARRGLDLLASSSLGVPSPVAAFAFLVLFLGVNRVLPIYGSMVALVLAYCFRIGIAYRMISAALIQIGPQLEEASALSGGSPAQTLRKVVLPLLAPTIVVQLVLGVVTAVHELTVPLFVSSQGPQPVSVYTFGLLSTQQTSPAAAVGVLSLVVILVLVGLSAATSRRWSPNR